MSRFDVKFNSTAKTLRWLYIIYVFKWKFIRLEICIVLGGVPCVNMRFHPQGTCQKVEVFSSKTYIHFVRT